MSVRGALTLAWALLGVIVSAPLGAVPIDVTAAAHVEAQAQALGREIIVSGAVVDDLGAPLARQPLSVLLSSDDAQIRGGAESGPDGLFEFRRVVPPGAWRIRVERRSDPFVVGGRVDLHVDVSLGRARVDVQVPGVVPARATETALRFDVGVGDAALSGAGVVCESTCGASGAARTDASGAARVALALAGPPGVCTLTCRLAPDDRVQAWRGGPWEVRRVEAPTLSVSARAVEGGLGDPDAWEVVVRAVDAAGPITGARLDLLREDEVVANGRSDAAGALTAVLPAVGGAYRVRFHDDVGSPPLTSDPLELRTPVPRTALLSVAITGLLLFGVVGIAVAVWRERAWVTRPTGVPASARAAETETLDDGVPRLRVFDAETGAGIAASAYDGDTVYSVPPDGLVRDRLGGAREVRITSPGYIETTAAIGRVPGGDRVALAPIRREVRALLERVIDEVSAAPPGGVDAWWGRVALAQVRDAVSRDLAQLRRPPERAPSRRGELGRVLDEATAAGDPVAAFEALCHLVDELYFAERGADEETLALARRLAGVVTRRRGGA